MNLFSTFPLVFNFASTPFGMIKFFNPGWIVLCLLNIIACTSTGQTELPNKTKDSDKPTKRQLRQSLRNQASITIVYGNQDLELAKAYQQILEQGSINFRWIDIVIKNESQISDEAFKEQIIYLVGTPQSNACLLYTSPSPRDRTRSRMPSSA